MFNSITSSDPKVWATEVYNKLCEPSDEVLITEAEFVKILQDAFEAFSKVNHE